MKIIRTPIHIVFLFFIVRAISLAQQPAYVQYGPKDGIPNYNYIKTGYAGDTVFVTLMGGQVYYFDGIRFQRYSNEPGRYQFSKIDELQKGKIFVTFHNEFLYLKNGKWHKIPFRSINYMIIDKTLYGFFDKGFRIFDEDNLQWSNLKPYPQDMEIKKVTPQVFWQKNKKIPVLADFENHVYYAFNDNFKKSKFDDWLFAGKAKGYPLFVNTKNGKIKWDYCDTIFSPEYFDNAKNLFKGTVEKSDTLNLFSFYISHGNKKYFFSLDTACELIYRGKFDVSHATIAKVKDDMYFMSSYDGLYKINPYVSFYNKLNSGIGRNIHCIVKHKGKIWAGSYGEGFFVLGKNGFEKAKNAVYQKDNDKNILPGAFMVSPGEAWFLREGTNPVVLLKDNKLDSYHFYIKEKKDESCTGFYIDTLHDGRLAFGLFHHGLGILDSIRDKGVYIRTIGKKKGMLLRNVVCFAQDAKGRIWAGLHSHGIAVYDMLKDTAVTFLESGNTTNNLGATTMAIDKYDRLWTGTEEGLFFIPSISKLDYFTGKIYDKAVKIRFPDDNDSGVFAIKINGDTLIAAKNNSVNFIKLDSFIDPASLPVHQLRYHIDINGFSVLQNSIFIENKNHAWVSNMEGLLKIDMRKIHFDTTGVRLHIKMIKNGDSQLNIVDGKIKLDPVKRNLSLQFAPVENPSLLNNIYYDFVLKNNKNDTLMYKKLGNKTVINFDYLNPGKYQLVLNAYKNGIKKDQLALAIVAPYTFFENPALKTLVFILLLALSGLYWFWRNTRLKQVSEKKLMLSTLNAEKEKLNVNTIISSFNPNLINNSLNWIQARYYKDNIMTNMVGKLSHNINYIFKITKSGKAYHSLYDELELVKNYIAIQKIRFNYEFNFIIPESIKKYYNMKLLVLQIQAHVENAIEHGLRNRIGSSMIKLEIHDDDEYYHISITDDGIGRKKAKKIGLRNPESGTALLKKLYKIFNKNPKNKLKIKSVYYDDIFYENGTFYGTKVVISIPVNFNYELL